MHDDRLERDLADRDERANGARRVVEVTDLYGDGVVNGVDVADGSCYDEAVVQTLADFAGADLNGAGEGPAVSAREGEW